MNAMNPKSITEVSAQDDELRFIEVDEETRVVLFDLIGASRALAAIGDGLHTIATRDGSTSVTDEYMAGLKWLGEIAAANAKELDDLYWRTKPGSAEVCRKAYRARTAK